MNLDNVSAKDLRRAADLRDKIESLQSELEQLLTGRKKPGRKPKKKAARKTTGRKTAKKKGTKRKMSAAGREAIRLAQKKRWAKQKRQTKAAKK